MSTLPEGTPPLPEDPTPAASNSQGEGQPEGLGAPASPAFPSFDGSYNYTPTWEQEAPKLEATPPPPWQVEAPAPLPAPEPGPAPFAESPPPFPQATPRVPAQEYPQQGYSGAYTPHPYSVQQAPQWQGQVPSEHPSSLTVLLLGIAGLFIPLVSFIAWYMGSQAKKESVGKPYSTSSLQVGWILGVAGSVLQLVFMVFFLAILMGMTAWVSY